MTFRFEPATSYRTRGGFEAYVLRNQRRDDALYGYVFTPDGSRSLTVSVAPMLTCWFLDGRISPNGDGPYDLMDPCNLIEPASPREIIDPEYDVSRLGPKKVHENVTDRIESIVKRLTEIEATIGPLAPYRVRSVDQDLTAIHARIAKSDEEAALNLTATDARMDRLSGIINEQEKRLKAMGDALQGTDHEGENVKRRLDVLERKQGVTKTFITAMSEAINKLENLPGLATLNAAVVDQEGRLKAMHDWLTSLNEMIEDRATMTDLRQVHSRLNRIAGRLGVLPTNEEIAAAGPTPATRGRLYAGGWLNIYVDDASGKLSVGVLHEDRATCDKRDTTGSRVRRIACVPFTRIREGDGL